MTGKTSAKVASLEVELKGEISRIYLRLKSEAISTEERNELRHKLDTLEGMIKSELRACSPAHRVSELFGENA
jgi:hypothetical protein